MNKIYQVYFPMKWWVRPIVVLSLLIFILAPSMVSADKIQAGETWVYEDSFGNIYNEIAQEIVQLPTGDTYLAVTIVKTNLSFQYPTFFEIDYSFLKSNIQLNITFDIVLSNEEILYLTQEGGYPLLSNNLMQGYLSMQISTSTYSTEVTYSINEVPKRTIQGSPSKAFATAETSSFKITDVFREEIYTTSNHHSMDYLFEITLIREVVISTHQTLSEPIRNYTVTPSIFDLRIDFYNTTKIEGEGEMIYQYIEKTSVSVSQSALENIIGISHDRIIHENSTLLQSVSISSNEQFSTKLVNEQPILLTWDESEKLPVYIKQTEGAKIGTNTIELNGLGTIIEYYLKIETKLKSDDVSVIYPFNAIFFISIITIIIEIKKKTFYTRK